MLVTDRHRAAEARFITMIEEAGMPAPDRVDYGPVELVFYWDEPKTAVVVELDGE
jgi:hypothetical protein